MTFMQVQQNDIVKQVLHLLSPKNIDGRQLMVS